MWTPDSIQKEITRVEDLNIGFVMVESVSYLNLLSAFLEAQLKLEALQRQDEEVL